MIVLLCMENFKIPTSYSGKRGNWHCFQGTEYMGLPGLSRGGVAAESKSEWGLLATLSSDIEERNS